jgi:DNA-binding NarL/FixJ family response regulator
VLAAMRLVDFDGPPQQPVPPRHDHLSPREREVAALIARGLTNRQIAGFLVIGERTVHTHVANILGKLDLTSRTQIAAWVMEQAKR